MTSNEYIKTIRVKDLDVDLGVDDYGQSYFIEWEDDEGRHEMSVGSYNTDYLSTILYYCDPEYKRLWEKMLLGQLLTDQEKYQWEQYQKMIDDEYSSQRD